MTELVRRFLKTAVAFLVAGLAVGLWMMVERDLRHHALAPRVVSAHTHLILVGFVMMMILGVALWMFPRPAKGDSRYRPEVAEAAYWLVSVGTACRAVGELLPEDPGTSAVAWVIIAGGVAQGAGLVVFFATMWSRIRPVGRQAREAAGERF
jgi:heme/copper-type cytochrome/quinol oxidase subunit 1